MRGVLAGAILLLGLGGTAPPGAALEIPAPALEGVWETELELLCSRPSCPSEQATFQGITESELTINLAWTGMTWELVSLWGWYGPAHVALESTFALSSAFTLASTSVLAVPFGRRTIQGVRQALPVEPGRLLFLRHRLDLRWAPEGVELGVGLVHEDVAFPSPFAAPPSRYDVTDQRFASGVLGTAEGETANGTELEAEIGFGADPDSRRSIQGASFAGEVTRPDELAWTSATLAVDELGVGPSATAEAELACEAVEADPPIVCELEAELARTNPFRFVLPTEHALTMAAEFDPVYPDSVLDGLELDLAGGGWELRGDLDGTFALEETEIAREWRIRTGDALVTLEAEIALDPTDGFDEADVEAAWNQEDRSLELDLAFAPISGPGRLHLEELELTGERARLGVEWETVVELAPDDGLDELELTGRISF